MEHWNTGIQTYSYDVTTSMLGNAEPAHSNNQSGFATLTSHVCTFLHHMAVAGWQPNVEWTTRQWTARYV